MSFNAHKNLHKSFNVQDFLNDLDKETTDKRAPQKIPKIWGNQFMTKELSKQIMKRSKSKTCTSSGLLGKTSSPIKMKKTNETT